MYDKIQELLILKMEELKTRIQVHIALRNQIWEDGYLEGRKDALAEVWCESKNVRCPLK